MLNCPSVLKFFAKAEAWSWFEYTKIQQQQEDLGYTLSLSIVSGEILLHGYMPCIPMHSILAGAKASCTTVKNTRKLYTNFDGRMISPLATRGYETFEFKWFL